MKVWHVTVTFNGGKLTGGNAVKFECRDTTGFLAGLRHELADDNEPILKAMNVWVGMELDSFSDGAYASGRGDYESGVYITRERLPIY